MSIQKVCWLAVIAAAWGPGAWAEDLLPDHVVQAIDTGPPAHASTARWWSVLAAHQEPIAYLAEAGAGPSSRARLDAPAARPVNPPPANDPVAPVADTDAPALLIEALAALGPMGVSISDYLAVALPGLPGQAAGSAEGSAGRTRGAVATQGPVMNFLPTDAGNATPRPSTQAGSFWALPAGLTERLTRYLFLAAAAALGAGALLRVVQWTRRITEQPLAR